MEEKPSPFEINQEGLLEYFLVGMRNFGSVWQQIVEGADWDVIQKISMDPVLKTFHMPVETWVRIVYRYANAFHKSPRQRMKLLDTMIPLYYGRVASLVNELENYDSESADSLFKAQAQTFEDMKDYLLENWQ